MRTKTSMALLAAGVVSLLAFGIPNLAEANHYVRHQRHEKARKQAARQEIRQDWGELQRDRAELRRDEAELARDRADLRRLYRNGASRGEIARKKAEVRQDLGEIFQDRREIRDDLGELRRDRNQNGNGWENDRWSNNRGRWDRNNDGWRGWGNDRFGNRDRRGWDFGRN